MYNNDSKLTIGKIFYGIVFSLTFVLLMKIGVFKDVYDFSAVFFRDFQQQSMVFFGQVKQNFDFINNLGDLKTRNDELSDENAKLISENTGLKNKINENNLIANQQSLNPQFNYLPVRISKYKDNQTEIILNKGSNENIQVNDVIVSENYLIGHVTEVFNYYSIARLIIDSNHKIAVESQSTKLKGMAFGDGINSIMMKQVPNEKKLEMSEIIITAGTDGIYPYGLIVGKIIKIESQVTDIEQTAEIDLELKIKDMREVFIIKSK